MAPARNPLTKRVEGLFAEAQEDGALERVAEELLGFAQSLQIAPALRAALADVTIPTAAKESVLGDLLSHGAHPATLKAIATTVESGYAARGLVRALQDLGIEAYLALAQAEGALPEVEDELFRFGRLLQASNDLNNALTDLTLPATQKGAVLDDLLGGKASERTVAILEAVVAQNRAGDLRERVLYLASEAGRRRARVVVEARTAVPLDEDYRTRLAGALTKASGQDIDLKVSIDPSITGGVVARVGDEVLDGSVRRKLELALERLTS